jgi:hypothetical protein
MSQDARPGQPGGAADAGTGADELPFRCNARLANDIELSEELWRRLGHDQTLACAPFPEADEALAAEAATVLPVQVNGKTRFTIEVPPEAGEPEIEAALRRSAGFRQFVGTATVQRLIIVPGKIVNLIVAERSVAP